jgi:mono/diheme cytochrome c family protein
MPGFAWLLSDRETAAVLTYIRNTWGNAAPEVTADDVARRREALKRGGG